MNLLGVIQFQPCMELEKKKTALNVLKKRVHQPQSLLSIGNDGTKLAVDAARKLIVSCYDQKVDIPSITTTLMVFDLY